MILYAEKRPRQACNEDYDDSPTQDCPPIASGEVSWSLLSFFLSSDEFFAKQLFSDGLEPPEFLSDKLYKTRETSPILVRVPFFGRFEPFPFDWGLVLFCLCNEAPSFF